MKLTDWFPADVKPTHIGEYDFKYEYGYQFRAFFDGTQFLIRDLRDLYWWDRPIIRQGVWRGLAEPPKKAKAK